MKQNREVTEQRESEMKRKSVRKSQSAEMKEQCGHEVEKKKSEIKTKCPDLKGECGE